MSAHLFTFRWKSSGYPGQLSDPGSCFNAWDAILAEKLLGRALERYVLR